MAKIYTVPLRIRITPTTEKDIEELAEKLGCNKSEAVRRAVLMANRWLGAVGDYMDVKEGSVLDTMRKEGDWK